MTGGLPRLPLFAGGALALLAGLLAGLARIGWDVPFPDLAADLIGVHGPLMVCGFFGTVIGLERAVALARPWAYGAPALSAFGALGLAAGLPVALGGLMLLGGGLVFVAIGVVVVRRHRAMFTVTLALGAVAWPVGVAAWLFTGSIPAAVAPWACFLVLTIAGERLELSRFLPPSRWKGPGAVVSFGLLLAGAALTAAEIPWGSRLFGLGLLALAVWVVRHDVARRTVRQPGLTRYTALSLLSGYVWLTVAGVLALVYGLGQGGFLYDAILHSLFVGFVFAMVFGHAPVILPAVLRVPMPYHRGLYVPLVLLHASLVLRVFGDLAENEAVRRWGGLLNAIVVVGFLLTAAATILAALRRSHADGAAQSKSLRA
jgi:hypothetical protein